MSGIALPQPIGAASGWRLDDWRDVYGRSAAAPASGVITIELEPVPPDELWLVDRLVVQCSSTTTTTAKLFTGAVDPARLVEATLAGNLNAGDWPGGVLLRPMVSLIVQWTGASLGAIGTVTGQARVMRRS